MGCCHLSLAGSTRVFALPPPARPSRDFLPRPFRTPWPTFVCIAGAVVCGTMMVSLGPATWLRLVIWTAIGVLIYAFYGYRHSGLRRAANGAAAAPRTA